MTGPVILTQDTERMLWVVTAACLIVLLAVGVDLASGLTKAKQSGKPYTSGGLKRTLAKLVMYEGALLISGGIDLLIHYGNFFRLFGVEEAYGIPVVTCVVAVYACVVEIVSVRETSDQKTRRARMEAEKLIEAILRARR